MKNQYIQFPKASSNGWLSRKSTMNLNEGAPGKGVLFSAMDVPFVGLHEDQVQDMARGSLICRLITLGTWFRLGTSLVYVSHAGKRI